MVTPRTVSITFLILLYKRFLNHGNSFVQKEMNVDLRILKFIETTININASLLAWLMNILKALTEQLNCKWFIVWHLKWLRCAAPFTQAKERKRTNNAEFVNMQNDAEMPRKEGGNQRKCCMYFKQTKNRIYTKTFSEAHSYIYRSFPS